VLAILPGLVVATYKTGELTGYGNLVVLKHGPDAFSLYAHLAAIFVTPGQSIAAGYQIGSVGNTAGTKIDPGAKTGEPHLHLEALTRWPPTSRYADRVDPEKVLKTVFQADLPFIPRITTAAKRAAPLGFFFALLAALKKKRA
jgi:murein DD-endopeptidase MepM/ murein hydrolase activator NlpD